MNDSKDVSLEADRLEELLEAPVPSQPVVMIEYRSRGVPWSVLGTLLMLVAVAAAFGFYHYKSAERIRNQQSNAAYAEQVRATELAAAAKAAANGATVVPVLANMVETSVLQVAGPAEAAANETAKAAASPPADATKTTKVDLAANAPGSTSTGALEPAPPRVRTITKSPFDTEDEELPGSKVAGGDSVAKNGATAVTKAPDESAGAKLASGPKEAQAGDKANAGIGGDLGAKAQETQADQSGGALAANAAGAKTGMPDSPAKEPLPNGDEFLRQTAQESARKALEMEEERRAQAERIRAVLNDERVKFHEELRQVLETQGKQAGVEIDELVRRSGKLMDQKTAVRAKGVWRQLGSSQPARVNQLRAIDVPEAAILNFISDNLYVRMRSPGGPRDSNEVRVRAARMLLSYALPGENDAPELKPNPTKDLKVRGPGGAVPR